MGSFRLVKLTDPIQFTNVAGGLVPRGAYDNGTDYDVGDSVDYNGSSYVMHTNAGAGTLPTDTTKWQVLANKGNTGSTGATGADGAPGPAGADGIMASVVAGNNIDVDATDPANPIVSVETLTLADVSDVTASATEVNYTDGVTSAIQTQIDGKQPLDSDLTSWAAITRAAGFDTFVATPSGANLASLMTSALTAAKGGTGLTALSANIVSLLGAADYAAVRTLLGLVIGTNVQAWDADLDTIAGLTATTDNFIVSVSSAWASRTPSQVRTTLGLVIGTNVQAWDADLDTWATKTAPSGTVIGTTDTQTLTNKRINPRVTSVASSATPTPNADTDDLYDLTAQAAAAAFAAPSGTPVNGQKLTIRIKDNGTARALTWDAVYVAGGASLPTTTVLSKILTLGFIYNTANTLNKWQLVASAQES